MSLQSSRTRSRPARRRRRRDRGRRCRDGRRRPQSAGRTQGPLTWPRQGHRRTGVRHRARLRTECCPPPIRRRLRSSWRRSRLLRTRSRIPGLAVDNQRAAAVPVRRADHRPPPWRTRSLAAGPRLTIPARPCPFRAPTALHPLRVLPIRPRPVDRGRPLPDLLARQHAGDEGHRARKPVDSSAAAFRTVEEKLNRSDPGLVKIITDQSRSSYVE